MGRPKHHVDRFGKRSQDPGHGLDDVFDPLVRGQQAKGEEHLLAPQAELASCCGVERGPAGIPWGIRSILFRATP